MSNTQLRAMFKPKSIAVVGVSADSNKPGHQMLSALRDFDGKLYPVNPKLKEALGKKVYPDLSAIKSPVDLAILALPAKGCVVAASEAIKTGAKSLLVISGGFTESGQEGKRLQDQLVTMCRNKAVRLLGPNTSGFAVPGDRLSVSFAPGMHSLVAGAVGIVSQSGAINLTLCALAQANGLGVSLAVGVGNGGDTSSADIIEYMAQDDDTRVILAYLEGVSDGRKLYNAIRRATANKPVIIYTVGKAEVGNFAASHTGNLLGSFQLKESALKQAGAVVVSSLEGLIDAATVFSHIRLVPKQNPGVALVTGQAGPGMIISDYLCWQDVSMPELRENTVKRIGEVLPPMTYQLNPVDTGRPGNNFGEVLKIVASDPGIDIVTVFALHEPAAIDPVNLLKNASSKINKPVVFGTSGESQHVNSTRTGLARLNIATFTTPDSTARALWALVEDSKASFRNSGKTIKDARQASKALAIRSGIDEAEAKTLLNQIGITTPDRRVCHTHADALKALESLGYPCVVKILASEIQHKTEVGGVIVNIQNQLDLEKALIKIDSINVIGDKAYLLEAMAPPGLEVIVGGKNDASFGATVLLGMGGVMAEALNDVAIRLAPLDVIEAMAMINELKMSSLLNGWRGNPPLDKQALAETLVAVGDFLLSHPEISEIDLNPLRVYQDNIIALDALFVCA